MSTQHAALPPSGFDAGEEEGEKLGNPVDPSRVIRRLIRSRWWILGAFVIGVGIGLPVAKFVLKRDYRATAMLRYEGVPEIEGLQQAGTEEADLGSKLRDGVVRAFYLSVAPSLFGDIAGRLKSTGIADDDSRIVVEKPFGHDLASAQALNAALREHFEESQIYRIDHYLGKETVQNLLALRPVLLRGAQAHDRRPKGGCAARRALRRSLQ